MKQTNLIPGLAFALLVGATLSLFFIPAVIIRPFTPQSARGLDLAMAVRDLAPLWTLLTTGAALLVAVLLWRRVSRWPKAFIVLGMCLASGAAVMARVDYFEWMFHPVPAPGFESAGQAKLDPAEMVMAVRFGSDARAYPIRMMGYHHVVNDVVGGVPVVVLLNAVSHRSGVETVSGRAGVAFPARGNQQPELPHARRRNRKLVAASHGHGDLWPSEGTSARTRAL